MKAGGEIITIEIATELNSLAETQIVLERENDTIPFDLIDLHREYKKQVGPGKENLSLQEWSLKKIEYQRACKK